MHASPWTNDTGSSSVHTSWLVLLFRQCAHVLGRCGYVVGGQVRETVTLISYPESNNAFGKTV